MLDLDNDARGCLDVGAVDLTIDRGDGTAVELFLARPSPAKSTGALLFVHGSGGFFSAEEKPLMTGRCSIFHLA